VVENEIGAIPFSSENPPISIEADLAEIDLRISDGICSEKPDSNEKNPYQLKRKLIPYGCTKLRMTELPLFY
jgi:hypothetical protein